MSSPDVSHTSSTKLSTDDPRIGELVKSARVQFPSATRRFTQEELEDAARWALEADERSSK